MDPCWTLLPYIVFVTLPFMTPCGAQSCLSRPIPDMTIAINREVLQTVSSTDPLYTADPEQCAAACCAQHKIAGHKDCNLYIFDTRKIQKHLNCYLFHCPTPESCPLKRSKGIMSIWMLPENKGAGSHNDGPVIQVPVSSYHSKEEKSASKGTYNGFHSQGDKSQISDPKEQAESSETEKSAFSAQSQDDTKDRAEHIEHPNSSKAKEIGSDVQSQGHTIPDPIEHSQRSDSEDSDIQTLGDTSQLPDPIENSHSSESRNSDVQPQDDKSKATDLIVDSKSSEDRQSGVKSHGQKQISNPTENSQNSEEKKFASNKQSQVDRSQPLDSIEDSQRSKPKKTDAKSQGDTKQISDPTKDSLSSEANDSGYEGTKPQTSNLKKPSAIPDNRTHRKSSSDMESESESKESNLKGLSKGSETKIQVGSTDKDPENVQSHITSQMIDLAKDIEKQLDLMESNQDPSTDGSSLSSPDTSLHHNVSGSAHDVGVQNVPSSGADEKSSQADNNVMVLHPTKFLEERSTKAPSNLKSITSASHHLLITKAPQGNSHNNKPANGQQTPIEKDVKNALSSSRVGSRLSEEHTTTKALKTLHLTNSTKNPDTKSLYKTRTPVLATHSAPSKVFPERRSKATTLFPEPGVHTSKTLIDRVTLKSSDLANPESSFEEDHPDLTQHNAQSDRASKLDTHGATDNFFLEERYGLVAALVFGVVFLLVVIGLVGRKVSQVQRRVPVQQGRLSHQWHVCGYVRKSLEWMDVVLTPKRLFCWPTNYLTPTGGWALWRTCNGWEYH